MISDLQSSALMTDFHQLTMANAYFEEGTQGTAVFDFFVRKLPATRNFLVAAGLDQVLEYLEHLRFNEDELDWLRDTEQFSEAFLEYLTAFRFSGDVHAMSEGTVFFENEPVLRITAPLIQAQLVQSRIVNLLQFQILIATKVARCTLAAPGKRLLDFGTSQAHGFEAALMGARAAYIGGTAATSNTLAAAVFDIPTCGSMTSAFIEAHDDEFDAFKNFACAVPDDVVFVLDTHDVEAAARNVVRLANQLEMVGFAPTGVQINGGDMIERAIRTRGVLDGGDHSEIDILVGGDLDEYQLQSIRKSGAPVDGFVLDAHVSTSSDATFLDCVYQLQEIDGVAIRRSSAPSSVLCGVTQVYRHLNKRDRLDHDVLTAGGQKETGARPLLEPAMKKGKRLRHTQPLTRAREHAALQLETVPEALQSLYSHYAYDVQMPPDSENVVHRAGSTT